MRKASVAGKATAKKGASGRTVPSRAVAEASGIHDSVRQSVAHLTSRGGRVQERVAVRQKAGVLEKVIAGKAPFSTINSLSPIQRSELVEGGVPARLLMRLASTLEVTQERLYTTIGVSRATANRALKAETGLNPADSERAMGLARLVGQVEQIVHESGETEGFDAGTWVAEFLETEQASLGGRRPEELMRTSDGRAVVATLISQMQSGAYG